MSNAGRPSSTVGMGGVALIAVLISGIVMTNLPAGSATLLPAVD